VAYWKRSLAIDAEQPDLLKKIAPSEVDFPQNLWRQSEESP
jgi:hypothetical protein